MHHPLSYPSDCHQVAEKQRLSEPEVAATSSGIVITDATQPDHPVIYCNPTFEQITGYSRDEIIGRSCPLFQGSDIDPAAIDHIRNCLREDRECRVVCKSYRKDGGVFWSELSISPVRDLHGEVTQYITVVNDITSRANSAQLYCNLAKNFPNGGVFFFDFNLRYTLVEGPELAKVGLSKNMLEGKRMGDVLPPDIYQAIAPHCRAALAGQTTVTEIPFCDQIYFVQTLPAKNETGEVCAGMVIAQNITEQKQTLEALQQSETHFHEQATQLDRVAQELKQVKSQFIQNEKMSALGQLVAGVAHEINNPVNFITGNLEHASQYIEDLLAVMQLYQQQYPNPTSEIIDLSQKIDLEFLIEDLPKLISSMQMGANRIREIVLSLRNFSRVDESTAKAVDLHECLESTLLILQNRLKAKSGYPEIQVIQEYGSLPLVECYPGQLNQVFMNLLINAIDALDEYKASLTPEQLMANPRIIKIKTASICAHSSVVKGRDAPGSADICLVTNPNAEGLNNKNPLITDSVSITISDNGPGIAESVKEQLFTPFVTTKPVGKGTGLGLSISYHIVVEKHGGKLYCNSELGQGTEFTICIPVMQNSEQVVNPIRSKQLVL